MSHASFVCGTKRRTTRGQQNSSRVLTQALGNHHCRRPASGLNFHYCNFHCWGCFESHYSTTSDRHKTKMQSNRHPKRHSKLDIREHAAKVLNPITNELAGSITNNSMAEGRGSLINQDIEFRNQFRALSEKLSRPQTSTERLSTDQLLYS